MIVEPGICPFSSIVSLPCYVAPSFVPRSHGVISPMPKQVLASQVYGSSKAKRASGAASIKMMPIGVPKVAYRVPGSQQADWYVWLDTYDRMAQLNRNS